MIEWFLLFGKAVIAAIVCYGVYSLLTQYWEEAKLAFNKAWSSIRRLFRAVGVLVRRGKKLFKLFVVQTLSGEIETYEDEEDNGVEIDINDPNLTLEVRKALLEDDYLVVQQYTTI